MGCSAMRQLTKLTSSANQRYNVITENCVSFVLTLEYHPRTYAWVASIQYGDLQIDGFTLVVSPNILRQFLNNVPFGLAVVSTDDLDPLYIDDFSTQRVTVFVLSAAEVNLIESEVFS